MQKTQFSKDIFWRYFAEQKTFCGDDEITKAWHLLLVLLFIQLYYSVAWLELANRALDRLESSLFCQDFRSIQVKVCLVYFPTLFKNKKLLFKKPMLSKLLKVTIYVHFASKSTFQEFTSKDAAWKTEVFWKHYFSKTKHKSTKSIMQ